MPESLPVECCKECKEKLTRVCDWLYKWGAWFVYDSPDEEVSDCGRELCEILGVEPPKLLRRTLGKEQEDAATSEP